MKCKNCNTGLTKDEKRDCLVCLRCHPVNENPVPAPKKQNVKVDEPWTAGRIKELVEPMIREIVVDEIENYHIRPKEADVESIIDVVAEQAEPVATDWRAQAKELDIPLNKETGGSRKKIDVLDEIEAKLKVPA